jgi:MraZ protein
MPAVFLSTHQNKIDKKNRLTVPQSFRTAIGYQKFAGVILFRSPTHACIEGFDFASMKEISERLDHFDLFSSEQDDLATTIFAEAVQCPFDAEGRVVIPENLLAHADITDDAIVIGLGRKFQIWNPHNFEARQHNARDSVKTKGLTVPHKPPSEEGKKK